MQKPCGSPHKNRHGVCLLAALAPVLSALAFSAGAAGRQPRGKADARWRHDRRRDLWHGLFPGAGVPAVHRRVLDGWPVPVRQGTGSGSCACFAGLGCYSFVQDKGPQPRVRAGKRPGTGVGHCVSCRVFFQVVALGKGLSAARMRAGKGPLSGMGPPVRFQVVALGKGLSAARMPAGKGPGSRMGPLVCFQVVVLGKGLSAVRVRAGIGPRSGMGPPVCLSVGAPGKGQSAVRMRAGKGPRSGMKEPLPIGPGIWPIHDVFTVARKTSRAAGSPAQGCRRFTGWCSMGWP